MSNNRLFIIIAVFLISVVIAFSFDHKNTRENQKSLEKKIVQTSENTMSSVNNQVDKNPIEQHQNTNTQSVPLSTDQQEILNEIEQRVYSQDPYVEVTSLAMQMGLCSQEFEQINFLINSATVFQQQLQLNLALQQECETYRQQYPHLLTLSEKQLRDAFTPNSALGRALKAQEERNLSQPERNENSHLTLMHALKEKNSSLIMLSALFIGYGGNNNSLLQTLLRSSDTNYISRMNQVALMLISCDYQSGQSCRSTSMLMVMVCQENPDACGLDYRTWYDNNTLSGMKKDVEKLVTYYLQISS